MTIVFGPDRLVHDGTMHTVLDMRHSQWSFENGVAVGRPQHDTHFGRLTQVLAATTKVSLLGSALPDDGVVTV